MRILTISKPYVARPYRQKLLLLAKTGRYQMGLICPPRWGFQHFEEPTDDEKDLLWTRSLPITFPDKNHFHWYRGLEPVVREFSPDLLNIEEEDYSAVTFQGFRLAEKLNKPAIFFAWQNIYKRYPPPFGNFSRYIFRHARAAMGGSHTAGEILKRKGYRGPFHVVPQVGIDVDRFDLGGGLERKSAFKRAIGIAPEDFVVYYGGRVVEEKGVQILIEAARLVNDPRLKIVVVGSGPYYDTLVRLAEKKLAPDSFRFVAHVTATKMADYTRAADALSLCSLTRPNWQEQGPVRVVTESMAAKAVVIVSDSGELPDVVGNCGIVVPEGDPDTLAEQIRRVMTDNSLRCELAEKGYRLVHARYSASAVAEQCDRVFSSLVMP